MTYMTIIHERWNPQHLLLGDEVRSIYAMTDGVKGIYWWQMESIWFTLVSDGVHNIYSRERWIEQLLLIWNGVHIIDLI